MIKKNKWKLLISSLIILLPSLFWLIFINFFQDKIPIHFAINGEATAYSSLKLAPLFMPAFLLIMHWLCIFITLKDNAKNEQNKKVIGICFWIMPVISIYTSAIIYAITLGMQLNVFSLSVILIGLAFVIIGNYLPKCKQNRTMGIKLKWTLANEENWNMTHRFGGKIYVIIGIVCFLCLFLPQKALIFMFILVMLGATVPPVIYSYLYYRKQISEGGLSKSDFKSKKSTKAVTAVVIAVAAVITLVCSVITFTGNIRYEYGSESLAVNADYHSDITVKYSEIISVEYRESLEAGDRVFGFGSPRLLMGNFRNDEFGNYTRYSYTACKSAVVITTQNGIIVLSSSDAESTYGIYTELIARTNLKGE